MISIHGCRGCVIGLFCALISLNGFTQNAEKIDSLKKALRGADSKKRFEIEFELFKQFNASDQDQALLHANRSLEQALLLGDSMSIVRSYNARGYVLKNQGDLRQAIRTYEKALAIAKRNKFDNQVKFLLNNLALSHTSSASFDKALQYNFESLRIREAEGDALDISVALNNIGLVYQDLEDYDNALIYFEKSYRKKVEGKVSHDLDRSLINLGIVYNELGNFADAEVKLKKALAVCDSLQCNRPDNVAQANAALGTSLMGQEEFEQADRYYQQSLSYYQGAGDSEQTASVLSELAMLRYRQKQMDEAIRYLDQSQEIAKETSFRKLTRDNYLNYSRVYSALNDYKKASQYLDLYIRLNGEIFNGDLIRNISRIQTDYEERENIKTIAEKDEILELNEERIQQQRLLNILLGVVIVLSTALILVVFRNYQKIKAVNGALAAAKRVIEDQNMLLDQQVKDKTKELVDTNENLQKVNDELDNFIYKTSHDIRGPLASLKGMVNLAMMDVKDDKALGYLAKLDLTAEKLNMVLTRLLIVNRINHAELKPEVVHFEPIIQEILTLEMKKGVPSKIRIDYEVAPGIQLVSDKEMIRLILENLVDNAVKFYNESARVDSFVKIEIKTEEGHVMAHVMDNGVGIAQMNREKIFQMFVRASERSETGGIGLYLAKLATEKLGGDINLISTDEKYTEFIVRFPNDLQGIIDRRKEEKRKHDYEKESVTLKSVKA